MSRPAARVVAALALLGLALTGCGKKGPPIAPELRLPVPPAGLQASIDETAIVLTWANPGRRRDGTPLKDLAEVKLYRREESDGSPPKPAMLSGRRVVGYDEIATIRLDTTAPGDAGQWVDRQRLEAGHRYVYVLTAIDSVGRSSPPSERHLITFLAAPKPPGAVEATAGSRQVTLTWSAPTELTDETPVSGDLRYVVLRGTGSAGPLAVITPQPLTATSFTDTELENEKAYRYAVRVVRVDPRATVTGAPSAAVEATPIETTRPIPPSNLVAVPSSGALRLAWSPSPQASVALYAIYRATGADALARIGTTASGNTTFIDRDVRPGGTYRYAVSAIDNARRPNESARSDELTVTLP